VNRCGLRARGSTRGRRLDAGHGRTLDSFVGSVRYVALLLLVSGCSILFERPEADPDAGALPGGTISFATVRQVDALYSPGSQDDDPSLTEDLLEMYFNSTRDGGQNVWVSRREHRCDEWGLPAKVEGISSEMQEQTPQISRDGLTIYFARHDQTGTGTTRGFDLFFATRPNRDSPWGNAVALDQLNTEHGEYAASPNRDETLLVFHSRRIGGGATDDDLFLSRRSSKQDEWGSPEPMVDINTFASDHGGHFGPDDLLLFFDSDRPGGLGGDDIYVAYRDSVDDPFLRPELVVSLNTEFDDEDIWVSDDLEYAVFASDRDGRFEIYEAFRTGECVDPSR
jgi:hypothetical protein